MADLSVVRTIDSVTAGHRAAERFATLARNAIAARGRFTVALAGGSSPQSTHAALAAWNESPSIEWPRVHALFGDERAVPSDDPRSNYGAARASLLERVAIDPAQVYAMEAWREDLERAADDYERAIERACGADRAIDLVMLGVGEDAHILSLFPGCDAITDDGGRSVIALRDPPMNPAVHRLSLTPAALSRARAVIVLVLGAKKRDAWRALDREAGDAKTHPVRLLRALRAPVWVIGDSDALE
jgi:6-phosphogluconolactonase